MREETSGARKDLPVIRKLVSLTRYEIKETLEKSFLNCIAESPNFLLDILSKF